MHKERVYQIALGLTSGVGDITTRHLISYLGSATEVFKCNKGKLMRIPGIGPKTAEAILSKNTITEAEEEYTKAEKYGAKLLFYTDKDYPNRLKSIADAPALLYYKGNADLNADKIVALVGTRSATAYGKGITEEIVSELTKFKSIILVSGLAYGIDITAHKAALKHNIPTLGVMANGIDIIYPSLHKNTALQMMEEGGILTEYKVGSKPDAPNFPARNRIIAGLSDALIVVEAAATGGALITAEIANSYNKDVFAVPGNIGAMFSEGCNNLIKTHKASIYTNVKDLEYLMNWEKNAASKKAASIQLDISHLGTEEKQVIALLQNHKEMLIDEISWNSQVPLSKLASVLLNLELEGVVKALPGKKFTLL